MITATDYVASTPTILNAAVRRQMQTPLDDMDPLAPESVVDGQGPPVEP